LDRSATGQVTAQVVQIYLDELAAQATAAGLHPDALVLGCTHYPLLRPLIEAAVPASVRVIDSAQAVAEAAMRSLRARLMPAGAASPGQIRCFATDSVDKFERLGPRFLGHPVGKVQLVDLGG